MKIRTTIALALIATLAVPPARPPAAPQPERNIDAYRGLGAWVDIYDPRAWRNPEQVVERLVARGVRTLYLQTANYRRRGPIFNRAGAGRFLEAAHARDIDVVAWYLPGFVNMKMDLRRSLAAIRFRSPAGEKFDSFALDIESTEVRRYWERNRRLLKLSSQIRRAAGPNYPLGAIHYSPWALTLVPSTWPSFPYAALSRIYDVFMPMSYYSYRAHGASAVYEYLTNTVRILRKRARRPDIAIHAIGGIANGSNAAEGLAFVRAAREHGVIGASMYDESIMGEEDWAAFSQVQPNPRQSPPMPLRPWKHADGYGNIPGGDATHPAEVVFRTGALRGARELDYEGFDIGADEVDVLVNWRPVAALPPGVAGGWSGRTTLAIPDPLLFDTRPNVIAFVPRARHPNWGTWGVRGVTFTPAPLALSDTGTYGALPGTGRAWTDRVSYAFESTGAPLTVAVRGFDIAAGEVLVVFNGQVVGELPASPDAAWGAAQPITLSPVAGANRLTFDNVANPPAHQPWGAQIVT